MVTLESARALAPGEMTASVKGAALTADFDPGVVAGTAEVRRGATEHIELAAEGSMAISRSAARIPPWPSTPASMLGVWG
jgi:hypothetical protein